MGSEETRLYSFLLTDGQIFCARPLTHELTAAFQKHVFFNERTVSEQHAQPPLSQNAPPSVLVSATSKRGSVCRILPESQL